MVSMNSSMDLGGVIGNTSFEMDMVFPTQSYILPDVVIDQEIYPAEQTLMVNSLFSLEQFTSRRDDMEI